MVGKLKKIYTSQGFMIGHNTFIYMPMPAGNEVSDQMAGNGALSRFNLLTMDTPMDIFPMSFRFNHSSNIAI